MDIESLLPSDAAYLEEEGLLLDPELPLVSFSAQEAALEARRRVIDKLQTMSGHQVLLEAIKGMMRITLLEMSLDGAEFPTFEYEVELPPQRVVFFVRLAKEPTHPSSELS